MTLQECKDSVAQKYGADTWELFKYNFAEPPFALEEYMDEVAELYALHIWYQACRSQIVEVAHLLEKDRTFSTPKFKQ